MVNPSNKSFSKLFSKATVVIFVSVLLAVLQIFPGSALAAEDLTTQYRVYQNDKLLKEFKSRSEAIQYAKWFKNSYVEDIETRSWVYSQFPTYMVYQYDHLLASFFTLEDAIKEARKWSGSSIRNVEQPGWVWDQYPQQPLYRVYQNENTLEDWSFQTLEAAKKEAAKWANSHIIDLKNFKWVWDNISPEHKQQLSQGSKIYKVYQSDYSGEDWEFASLEEAKAFSLRWSNSIVVNTAKQHKQVFSTEKRYAVYQNDKELQRFSLRDDAIVYAKRWANGKVKLDGRVIWSNEKFYKVIQDDLVVQSFSKLSEALQYGLSIQQASIVNLHGKTIWDNSTRLLFWAWNGSATDQTVKQNVANTLGLDVNSPTWFELKNAQGEVTDKSSEALVRWLKDRNLEIHPLIHNQFNNQLTNEFLQDDEAQQQFIQTIVNRSVELGVDGLNLDFESMFGKDRDAFTDFVKKFAAVAHAHDLTVSIDLARGSMAWNHLTAYDHQEIANIVDYIIIMTYDQHWTGSKTPGSVAGMAWTEQGIQEFLSYGIPRDKLIMGIPFYIREWKLNEQGQLVSNRTLHSAAVRERLADKDYTTVWDPVFDQYKITFKEDDHMIVFWLEDQETVKKRLALAKEYRLAGVAVWRLGQESPAHWEAMIQAK